MMSRPRRRRAIAVLAAIVSTAPSACRTATPATVTVAPAPTSARTAEQSEQRAIERARADSVLHPWTAADQAFMTGMIGHHGQALLMAGWAPSHGASNSVQILAERIINEQQDEIRSMQQWLRDRRQPVPDGRSGGMMMMGGAGHEMPMANMLMPGMLTDPQLAQLDAARGQAFDRLFLRFMIQHHRGAVSMVNDLFATYGAGQNEAVFKFASDVNVDQSTEIARMEKMLAALPPG